jgi:energy-converting hydrogenase A subunit M
MLLKCYYHLHPLVESKRGVVDQKVEEDMSLDIFEMITNTSEPSMKLINKELLIFKCYQVDVKNIKCPMQYWE